MTGGPYVRGRKETSAGHHLQPRVFLHGHFSSRIGFDRCDTMAMECGYQKKIEGGGPEIWGPAVLGKNQRHEKQMSFDNSRLFRSVDILLMRATLKLSKTQPTKYLRCTLADIKLYPVPESASVAMPQQYEVLSILRVEKLIIIVITLPLTFNLFLPLPSLGHVLLTKCGKSL